MTTYVGFDVRIAHAVDGPLELQRKLQEFIRTLPIEPGCTVAPVRSVEIMVNSGASPHGWLDESDGRRADDWRKEFDLRAVLARIVAARDGLSPEFRLPADLETAINGGRASLGNRCEVTKLGEYHPLRCARSRGHSGDHAYVVDGEYDLNGSP
jgi:hypothetical protein